MCNGVNSANLQNWAGKTVLGVWGDGGAGGGRVFGGTGGKKAKKLGEICANGAFAVVKKRGKSTKQSDWEIGASGGSFILGAKNANGCPGKGRGGERGSVRGLKSFTTATRRGGPAHEKDTIYGKGGLGVRKGGGGKKERGETTP